MMKSKSSVLAVILVALCSTNLIASEKTYEERLLQLNEATVQSLGISISALALLYDAAANVYFPIQNLERSGSINAVRELEGFGFIRTKRRMGLPDGQDPQTEYIVLLPTDSGEEIRSTFLSIQHNKALRRDSQTFGLSAP